MIPITEMLLISAGLTGVSEVLGYLLLIRPTNQRTADSIHRLETTLETILGQTTQAADLPVSTASRVSDLEAKLPRVESKAFDAEKKVDEHITQLNWHRNTEHAELTKTMNDVQKEVARVKEQMRHVKDW
jgi:hypothetical protein